MVRNPGYTRKAPWSDRDRARPARDGGLEVHPRGGHARDDARERRDAGRSTPSRRSRCRGSRRTRRCASRRCRGRACRASGCSTRPSRRSTTCKVRRAINYAVDKDAFLATRVQGHRAQGRRAAHRGHARRSRAAPGLSVRSGQGQGAAGRGGLAAGRRRHPDQGRPAARDRAERHRVRRRRRPDGAAHPVARCARSASTSRSRPRPGRRGTRTTTAARPTGRSCSCARPIPTGSSSLFHSSLVGANFNWSCVKNAKLDELLEQGRRESDPAKRRAIYLADREARARRGADGAAGRRALGVGVSGRACRARSTTSTPIRS